MTPALHVSDDTDACRLSLSGDWVVNSVGEMDLRVRAFEPPNTKPIVLDLSALSSLDTAGAWIIYRFRKRLEKERIVMTEGLPDVYWPLLDVVAEHEEHVEEIPIGLPPLMVLFDRIGRFLSGIWRDTVRIIGFFGLVMTVFARLFKKPKRFRFTSFVHHMEATGLDATPIILLITFLIGAVIAFMSADVLRQFGLEIYTVNFVPFAFLRELGVLLTAIMVAGRSGSAFTAQIGTMKSNEEIDAMKTLGLDPIEVLVLPRVMALLITLPILTFLGDIAGLIGATLVSWSLLDMSPIMFLTHVAEETEVKQFWLGMAKAPFFALLISIIGSYQGLRVSGTAESIGRHTTIAVVQSVFAVIVADALFAIFYQVMGW